MALIVVFPVLPFVLAAAELGPVVPGGNYLDFLPAEFALKRSEHYSAVRRVGVYWRVFLPPFFTAFMGTEPLPFLFWFVAPSAIIAELHTFLSTVIWITVPGCMAPGSLILLSSIIRKTNLCKSSCGRATVLAMCHNVSPSWIL